MPILLSRQLSITSLASIVEKCQRQPMQSPLEYDLQLKSNLLELILLSRPSKVRPPVPPKPNRDVAQSPVLTKLSNPTSADEGFESDIDTISLISCENESFSNDKTKPVLAETDSANGGSGTESETETEKANTLTQKNVNSIRESLEKHGAQIKERESFDLVDCVCYTDVTYPDVLIFVIKNEALVFKFDNLEKLQAFYTNFTTLKAVTNQKAYSIHKNITAPRYNLLQRTDHNGVTHIEIKKQKSSSNVEKEGEKELIKVRQRTESKLINELLSDSKFTSKQNSAGSKPRVVRSSSIEDILNLENKESDLVSGRNSVGSLRKVWNSAEDLLDSDTPRRPERRRKKKPAPLPPPQIATIPDKIEDVFSGQFVRVNVNTERLKDYSDKNRLVVKSTNEPHPKKLSQNFNLLNKNNFTSLLKPSPKTESARRLPQENSATLNRPQRFEKNSTSSWTNSVPRLLKKSSRSKSETRNGQNFQPMAYRYIDTTADYNYNSANQNNAMFLNAMMRPKTETLIATTQPRISFGYNVPGFTRHQENNNMGNRVFGLTPKIKDFSRSEDGQGGKWASASDLTFLDREGGNLKSSIKHGEGGKKKNEKKVTFSAYTTVQVV